MKAGKIIIVTAPSGSGKTTLVKKLLNTRNDLEFSISACTRMPRNGEIHGKDYYFYDVDKFRQLIEENAFVEWEMVYTGKYYGTLRSELERIWQSGKYPLVDIDVNGALAIRKAFPETSLSIFIKTPTLEVLRQRLVSRGTENDDSLEERVNKAAHEASFAPLFHKIIVNDELEIAAGELISTVNAFLAS